MVSLVDDQVGEVLSPEPFHVSGEALDRADKVESLGVSYVIEEEPRGYLGPDFVECLTCLMDQFAGMNREERPASRRRASVIAVTVLPAPWAWVTKAMVFPLVAQLLESLKGFLLVGTHLQDDARLLGQEVIEGQKSRNPFQEQGKLFLDLLGFLADLSIGPTEDPPALVDQAVLPEQVVLIALRSFRGRERARSLRQSRTRLARRGF